MEVLKCDYGRGCNTKGSRAAGQSADVSAELQKWYRMQDMHRQLRNPEKVNGAEFHVDDKELGHIHLNGEMHLLLTKRLSRALIQNGLAEKFLGERSGCRRP